ncbi:long-chain-fatty-acid--CoA ligase [Yersinia pestis PY-71]|nr:non-ribosomal peptide synthetase [Yersinia pestis PY-09]EIS35985.1 non-ribosomal peptide synthetase [Yersinia pestis PY-56]EIS80352.1 long-chain-fatty-acid--CoA ligase [Yersinia pestis PY-71]EIT31787.1 long-chain-fatty-acid--CoA ligase [Yersinia pestis PY-95]
MDSTGVASTPAAVCAKCSLCRHGGGHGSGYLVQLLDSRYSANRVVLGALRRAIA